MGENKMKHVTPKDGKSKYAIKKEAQAHGHFSPLSPFGSTREHKQTDQKPEVKQ